MEYVLLLDIPGLPEIFIKYLRQGLFATALLCTCLGLNGQSSLTLTSSITTPNPSLTGNDVFLELAYACAGTTSDCDGTALKIVIPPGITYKSLSNSAHIASSSYDNVTREVTFNFVDPLMAGSTGTVRVRCFFPGGATPNNTIANFNSEISSSSTSPASVSSSTSVTAQAISKPWIAKLLQGSAAVNSPTTFRVYFCNASYSTKGSLNFTNVRIEDELPIGANFVKAESSNSSIVTTYDPMTRKITSTVGNMNINTCSEVWYTIDYTSPTFSTGNMVTNTAEMYFTPVGESPASSSNDETFELLPPRYGAELTKNMSGTTKRQGELFYYILGASNNGSSSLSDFSLVDVIPNGINLESVNTGAWFAGPGIGPGALVMEYRSNLNATWTSMTASPLNLQSASRIYTSSLGLAVNENVTEVRWRFSDFPTMFRYTSAPRLYVKVDTDATVGSSITNCLTYTTSTVGADPMADQKCATFTVTAAETIPILIPDIERSPSTVLDIGDDATITVELTNQNSTIANLTEYWGAVVVPKGFDVDPGSYSAATSNLHGVVPSPAFTLIPNFRATENTLLRIDWSTTGAELKPGGKVWATFKVSPNGFAKGGDDNEFTRYVGGAEASVCYSTISDAADVLDMNDDGDTAERLCYRSLDLSVVARIEVQTELEVKGALDVSWTKFPASGETLPGGVADYQVTVRNTGNVALEDVIILDILPHVGDLGVIDPQARLSEWSPNLAGPVDAPSGVVVQYSIESNPCRAVDGFLASDPSGCQTPNWSSLPPADITQVKSIRFDFGATLIDPQSEFVFSWPMRTPVNVFSQPGVGIGDLAWNSFGFVANRADNGAAILPAEPVKTGIALNGLTPGVVGDFIWVDADNDGIQDVSEPGLNGVRIELYRDNGDAVADPTTDVFVDFTVSADGGFYLFPNLPTGDYFVWFVKPPTFDIALASQGGDPGLDSDAIAYSNNGIEGAITGVFSVTNVQFDYSRDLGLSVSGNGAIGSYTWKDRNLDGIQNESSIDGAFGIQVELYSVSSVLIATTFSANNSFGTPGYSLFDNVSPGDYYLVFSHDSSPVITTADVGDDNLDSDANIVTGQTPVFTVIANSFVESWDCGFDASGVEDCTNGVDDDLDGLIDCQDEECPNPNPVTRILGL